MWIAGVICLIFNYQTVMSSKTFMTNEISMPFIGRKQEVPVIMWNIDNTMLQPKYRSSRFERLKAPDSVKPIFVRPAEKQVEEPMIATSAPPLIEVEAATVEPATVEFVPVEPSTIKPQIPKLQPETSTPAEIVSVTYAVPSPFRKRVPVVVEEESEELVEIVTIEPRFELQHFEPLTNEEAQMEVVEVTPETTTPATTTTTEPTTTTIPTTTTPTTTTSTTTTTPAPTTTTTIETTTTTSATVKPKKLRHKKRLRKHRKIHKSKTTTELPTTVPAETTTVAAEVTISPVILIEPPTRPTPIIGKPQNGESYLGGWNEEIAEIVPIETTAQPSLGSLMSQFGGSPPGIASSNDEEVQEYYKKYYEEWYRQHNIAIPSESSPIVTEAPEISPPASAVPKKINIKLGKKPTPATLPIETPTSQPAISPASAEPSKEQLDKVCDYVGKLSKSFGIKDTVTFAKNNCAFIKGFHPQATCEQVQHVMEYCATGEYVHVV